MLEIREHVPLAPLTTLELGGEAEYFAEVQSEDQLRAGIEWASGRRVPLTVLGGGSNVIIPDAGVAGLILRVRPLGIAFDPDAQAGITLVTAMAGEPFDGLVATSVARGLSGLECLSGIPGLVGATPIQNVGAYGQEVSEVIREVRLFDRQLNEIDALPPERCAFGYRDSLFKRDPGRYVVLSVVFGLITDGAATIRYAELARRLGRRAGPGAVRAGPDATSAAATLTEVREAVLDLRRGKSMVIEPDDDNRRSVGSFFTNPIVPADQAERVSARAAAEGLVATADDVPCFPAGQGLRKLSAAWLIERAGFTRGLRRGPVGISSRHCLALVHHGGGTTAQLLALAEEIRQGVLARFGIALVREPILVASDPALA